MRPIVIDGVAWSVGQSVCHSIMTVDLAKRLNQSRCHLGYGLAGPREPCIRWGQDPTCERAILRAKRGRPGHALTCPMFDVLKVTQQGVEPVWRGCRFGCTSWGLMSNYFDDLLCICTYKMTVNCAAGKQRGWWRITNPDTVKELLSCLTTRGIRERSFQKNLERYLNYACQLCSKSKKSGTC